MTLYQAIYEVVRGIPRGKVMSYGAVSAAATGSPRLARQVGWALHVNPDPENTPCHRVVFKDGCVCKGFAFGGEDVQRQLLQAEGINFINGKVDMQTHAYEPQRYI